MGNLSSTLTHAPGTANTAAEVVLGTSAGGGPNLPLKIVQIEFGYDLDPEDGTPGLLTVLEGATVCKTIPVTSKGAGFIPFAGGIQVAPGSTMTVRLSALSGKKGWVNVTPAL